MNRTLSSALPAKFYSRYDLVLYGPTEDGGVFRCQPIPNPKAEYPGLEGGETMRTDSGLTPRMDDRPDVVALGICGL